MILNDRNTIRQLHQAYADKIESLFRGLQRAPGDPYGTQLRLAHRIDGDHFGVGPTE